MLTWEWKCVFDLLKYRNIWIPKDGIQALQRLAVSMVPAPHPDLPPWTKYLDQTWFSFIGTLTPSWFWARADAAPLPWRKPTSPGLPSGRTGSRLGFICVMAALRLPLQSQFWVFGGLVLFLGYELLEEGKLTTVNTYWVCTPCQII